MEYTLDSTVGELFVVEPDVSRPTELGASIALRLRAHGIALVE